MNKRRNSSSLLTHGAKTFAVLLVQIITIIVIVAILLGVIEKYTNILPSKESENTSASTSLEMETEIEISKDSSPEEITESTIPENSSLEEIVIPENNSQEEVTETIIPEDNFLEENTSSIESDNLEESTENLFQEESSETIFEEESEIIPEVPQEPIGKVYLTFDDGPSTQITPEILDLLKEKDVKATFFIINYAYDSEREALVIREFSEGHTVALHGTSHEYSKIYSSLEALIENFTTLQEKVYNSTGYKPTIIRFPGGSSNTVSRNYCQGIMTEAVKYFSNSEFVYFDWNVDSQDAGNADSSQEVYENVISGIKPGRNNIVLMHDSSNKQFTLEALEAIINYCISEGYEFKAITPETPQVIHNVAN